MSKTSQAADPVIDRVRQARHEISARFGHDTAKLVAHYMELQKQHSERLLYDPEEEKPKKISAA